MSTRFAHPDVVALDEQQTVLLDALRRARGAPVSYAQLQDAGIEFPASVVSELELMGVAIERRHASARGKRRLTGVRLAPADDPHHALAPRTPTAPRPSFTRAERLRARIARLRPRQRVARRAEAALNTIAVIRAPGTGSITRWLAPAALFCAAGVVGGLVLAQLPGGGQARDLAAHDRRPRPAVSAVSHRHTLTAAAGPRSAATQAPHPVNRPPPTPPTPVSAVLAAQLDAEGHDLLEAGRYGAAIGALQRTLEATGERLQDCLQPAGETCLTYAYALFDLGRALRLEGHPAAAVAVLRRRLQIDNQRATVQGQLELALTTSS